MKNILFIIMLFFVLLPPAAGSPETIAIFDLQYTLELNVTEPDELNMAWDHAHAVATLQGIVNRDEPRLYIYFIKNVLHPEHDLDQFWLEEFRKKGEWLDGAATVEYKSIIELFKTFRNDINGVVVYDSNVAATSNLASAIAGIENLVAVRYDTSKKSLYHQLVLVEKLPAKKWLLNKDGSSLFTGKGTIPGTDLPSTGSPKNDAYRWFIEHYLKKGLCNTEYGAYYLDQAWRDNSEATFRNHHTLSNHDFFVSKKAFFFDLSPWGDEPATDEPSQANGLDRETLKQLLLATYENNHGKKMCYIGGFPPWAFKYTDLVGGRHGAVDTEWEYTQIISAYNAFKDADAIGYGALANASFWQHFPLQKEYPQKKPSTQDLIDRGLVTSDHKVNFQGRDFLVLYVGDYDGSAWVSQTTPTIWDDPNRGAVPMMWCISPVLEERVPMALHFRRKTATPNDYFAASNNGAGYLNPGMLQEPRSISGLPSGLDVWAEHCQKYYQRWDLSITGFIIDGYAPALNEKGLDCYASFSPNGIVPQQCAKPAFLHNNMPVLQADWDINPDAPKEAARMICQRVQERRDMGLSFHWFRNVLRTPSWYVAVVEEVRKCNPDIVLLDGATFFELLEVWLKEGKGRY